MNWNTCGSGSLISILALMSLIGGCASDPNKISHRGSLAVRVDGARSFNPSISHGRIKLYRVTVEGEGIAEPIVAEFDGGASEGVIENIPSGNDRLVSVEAINENDVTIRAGEALDVRVGGGDSDVDVRMESVPIFTNLTDGNVVENSHLAIRLFADPYGLLVVDDTRDGELNALADVSNGFNEIYLDRSSGMGVLTPGDLAPGKHTLTVRNIETSRETSVDVFIVSGDRKPAPFIAAGSLGAGSSGRMTSWRDL